MQKRQGWALNRSQRKGTGRDREPSNADAEVGKRMRGLKGKRKKWVMMEQSLAGKESVPRWGWEVETEVPEIRA